MKARDRAVAMRQAKTWAFEDHERVMWDLPEEIRYSIDWEQVARRLGIKWPELVEPRFEDDLQRVIDYLYEDEATDYDFGEKSNQQGHIFESISAVQKWLNHRRNSKDKG